MACEESSFKEYLLRNGIFFTQEACFFKNFNLHEKVCFKVYIPTFIDTEYICLFIFVSMGGK